MATELRRPPSGRGRTAHHRLVAGGLRGVAFALMLVGVWGMPVVLLLADPATPAPGVAPSPWRLWSMVELSLASLAASYLLWSVADWMSDGT